MSFATDGKENAQVLALQNLVSIGIMDATDTTLDRSLFCKDSFAMDGKENAQDYIVGLPTECIILVSIGIMDATDTTR